MINTFFKGNYQKDLVDTSKRPKHSVRKNYEKIIKTYTPEIIMIGNSMLRCALDHNQFSKIIKKRSIKLTLDGSASSWWYLFTKNVIVSGKHKPKALMIFFRDHYLTEPDFRVNGTYKANINEMRNGKDEDLLNRLAYLNNMPSWKYTLLKHSHLFRQNEHMKGNLDRFVKTKIIDSFLGISINSLDESLQTTFHTSKYNNQLYTLEQKRVEAIKKGSKLTFDSKIKKSFLPEIVNLCESNGIKLYLIRVKKRRDIIQGKQPENMMVYSNNLKEYCRNNQVTLIDFSNCKSLNIKHYADGDHLEQRKGMPIFTRILANAYTNIILNEKTGKPKYIFDVP